MSWISNITREDFNRARHRALINHIRALFTRSTNDLLAFEEVRARLAIRSQHYLGSQTVPIRWIIGSEGRYGDFDRSFLPRQEATRARWISVDRAHHQGVGLPAVELYRLGGVYFVRDGHHRISVARQHGQVEIDARVTELVVDVALSPDLREADLPLLEEYSDFLAWTNLAALRPNHQIHGGGPGAYLDLIRHINAHRYYMGLERGAAVDLEDAVASWYDRVYLPVVQALREQGARRIFPRRSEIELYRWVMDHRWYLREQQGADPGPAVAVRDYARRFAWRGLLGRLGLGA